MPPRRRRTQAQLAEARRKARNARRHHLKTQHHMTQEQYDAILAFQGGVCSICERPPQPNKNLHVDHDHGPAKRGDPACAHPHEQSCSNCWRGLVHRHCNDMLAAARDSVVVLLNAVKHLEEPPAQRMLYAGTTEARPGTSAGVLRGGHELPVGRGLVAPEGSVRSP